MLLKTTLASRHYGVFIKYKFNFVVSVRICQMPKEVVYFLKWLIVIEFEVTGLAFKRLISLMNSFNMLGINVFVLFDQIWHNIYKAHLNVRNVITNVQILEVILKLMKEKSLLDAKFMLLFHMKIFLMWITSSNINKNT